MLKTELTAARVRDLFEYDSHKGVLINKIGRAKALPGRPVGHRMHTGYLLVSIDRKQYLVHRVIWLWVNGTMPKEQIDHINLDRADNRIENLREATWSQNMANRRAHKDNQSGMKGAYFSTQSKKWVARIYHGRNYHLGSYDTPEQAHSAYCDAAKTIFRDFARSE